MSKRDPFFRILCVEDNLMFQQMLKLALKTYGFEVITASHGLDALAQFEAHEGRFGAIVSDVEMPHLDGLGLVRSLREIGYKGRIVIMSGRLTVEDLHEYEPHAISGFFHKPFEISVLATMLLQRE